MSCCAIAKCTIESRYLSVAAGSVKVGRELRLRDRRKLLGGERLQVEAALAAGDRELLVGQRKLHVGLRQRAQDVDQLARGDRRGGGILAGPDRR